MRCLLLALLFSATSAVFAQTESVPLAGQLRYEGSFDTRKFFPQIQQVKALAVERDHETEPRWRMPQGPPNNVKYDIVGVAPVQASHELYPENMAGIPEATFDPADPDVAVGPHHVVQVVNTAVMFADKRTGKIIFQQVMDDVPGASTTIFEPFIDADSLMFDPRCWFDSHSQRFFLTVMEVHETKRISKIHLAYSDNADPMGSWKVFSADVKKVNKTVQYWADYNTAGYNRDAIVLPYLLFNFVGNRFLSSRILIIPKAPLLDNETVTTQTFEQAAVPTIQVAKINDATVDKVYGVARMNTTTLRVYAFSNLTGVPKMNFKDVAVTEAPTLAERPARARTNRRLEPGPDRVLSAKFRSGILYTAQTVPKVNSNGTYQLGVAYYMISTNSFPTKNPTLNQSGFYVPSGGADWTYPAVAVNADGDLAIAVTESSTGKNPVAMLLGRKVSDGKGKLTKFAAMNAENTTAYKSATVNRWGDYFGLTVDGGDKRTFWGTTMTTNGANWGTMVFAHAFRGTDSRKANPTFYNKNQGTSVTGLVSNLATNNSLGLVMKPAIYSGAHHIVSVDLRLKLPFAITRQRNLQTDVLVRGTDKVGISTFILNVKTNLYESLGTYSHSVTSPVLTSYQIPAPINDYVDAGGYMTINVQAHHPKTFTITLDQMGIVYEFHKS